LTDSNSREEGKCSDDSAVFPGVQAEHWQGLLNENVKGAVLLSYGAGKRTEQKHGASGRF